MDEVNRLVRDADGDEVRLRARVRELEAKLQQEKVDAVGRLAGGVAHDLNNLLTPILAYGNMLVEELAEGAPARDFALEMVKAGDRLVAMTKTLQTLRVKAGPLVAVPVAETVSAVLDRLAPELGAEVTVQREFAPGLAVLCESGQLERILEELLRNARQAMPAGGRLTVRVAEVADPAAARLAPEAWVELAVCDEGSGITPDVREHMFEPYFTTRPKMQGKGLGLAVAFAAVRRAGGQLRARSEFGAGTEMQVFLRRANGLPSALSNP